MVKIYNYKKLRPSFSSLDLPWEIGWEIGTGATEPGRDV